MNKFCIALFLTVPTGFFMYLHTTKKEPVIASYTSDTFTIPLECKHLALLGCTPHPTRYLEEHGNDAALLHSLRIQDFLDLDYVTDSFIRTFELCKEKEIDHLLIAYLPIYYVRMRPILGDQFVHYCRVYFTKVVPALLQVIEQAQQQTNYYGKTTLITPTDKALSQIPKSIDDRNDRTRYLIKQFPKLHNISCSPLETITIINNAHSQEDNMLIAYLKYEYLFEKPIAYHKATLNKERFHA